MANTHTGIFPALEWALQATQAPLDCQTLFGMPEVRKHAASVNRVADTLGGLWRKGLVVRLPAPKDANSRARWMYQWRGKHAPKPDAPIYTPQVMASGSSVLVTEDGNSIKVELIISIRQKSEAFPYLAGLKDS